MLSDVVPLKRWPWSGQTWCKNWHETLGFSMKVGELCITLKLFPKKKGFCSSCQFECRQSHLTGGGGKNVLHSKEPAQQVSLHLTEDVCWSKSDVYQVVLHHQLSCSIQTWIPFSHMMSVWIWIWNPKPLCLVVKFNFCRDALAYSVIKFLLW